jgi:uncharacterized protein (TIGR03067 family)
LRPALLVVVLLGLGFALWYGLFRDGGPTDDLGRLQGTWSYSVNDRNNLGTIRVEEDIWSWSPMGQPGRSYRMTLRPDASPKEIDLAQLGDDGQPVTFTHGAGKGSEVKLLGVYAFEAGTVKVALGVAARPSGFEGDEAQVLVLKK